MAASISGILGPVERSSRVRLLLNPQAEPFRPESGSPPSEEDVPLKSEEVADVLLLAEQNKLNPAASVVPERGESGEDCTRTPTQT